MDNWRRYNHAYLASDREINEDQLPRAGCSKGCRIIRDESKRVRPNDEVQHVALANAGPPSAPSWIQFPNSTRLGFRKSSQRSTGTTPLLFRRLFAPSHLMWLPPAAQNKLLALGTLPSIHLASLKKITPPSSRGSSVAAGGVKVRLTIVPSLVELCCKQVCSARNIGDYPFVKSLRTSRLRRLDLPNDSQLEEHIPCSPS